MAVCGGFFEHSPWIAERAWEQRPFVSREALHGVMIGVVRTAAPAEKVGLIAAHPDLVGRLAREGKLTRESTGEQAAAGLAALSDAEIAAFEEHNAAYRAKFGFPFVICARERTGRTPSWRLSPCDSSTRGSRKSRRRYGRSGKIAHWRLMDALSE